MSVQVSETLPTISTIYGVNHSHRSACVGDILSGVNEKKWENRTCGCVKTLKRRLLYGLGQVNAKNATPTDEVIKEKAKVLGHRMSVTDFCTQNWDLFFC
jgi:hypothetical protein